MGALGNGIHNHSTIFSKFLSNRDQLWEAAGMPQSAEERFDIYDERGNPQGTASRAEVHAHGWWHHTFHCWLVRLDEQGRARVLFQRRSDTKDTNPGGFDITAAGHLNAGETPREAVREMEEELGLTVEFEDLTPYGIIREEASGELGGKRYIDREVSHVYGLVTELRPKEFRLEEEEVAALYEADAIGLIAMLEGRAMSVQADGIRLSGGKTEAHTVEVRASEFVSRDYAYYVGVFGFLRQLAERPRET
jgi:isopentenyldiphosphate isomerase